MEIFESSAVNPTLLRPAPRSPVSNQIGSMEGRKGGTGRGGGGRRYISHSPPLPPPRHFVCFRPSPSLRPNGNKRKRELGFFLKSQRSYVVRWRRYTSLQKKESVCVWPFWGKLQGCIVRVKSIPLARIERNRNFCIHDKRGKRPNRKKTYLELEGPLT